MDHRSPIEGVVQEEYLRQKELKIIYEKEIKTYPKGTIVFQKRKANEYGYLKYREGLKTINKYIGPKESDKIEVLSRRLKKRKEIEEKLKQVKKNIKRMEKGFRATN